MEALLLCIKRGLVIIYFLSDFSQTRVHPFQVLGQSLDRVQQRLHFAHLLPLFELKASLLALELANALLVELLVGDELALPCFNASLDLCYHLFP